MARGKHLRHEKKVEEVIIRERSGSGYYDSDDDSFLTEDEDTSPEIVTVYKESKTGKKKILLLIVLILALFIGVFVYMMRSTGMTASDVIGKIKVAFMGTGVGDGYPVSLTGSDIGSGDFFSVDGNIVTLSNTALTVVDSTGKQKFSVPHSYSSPAVRENGGTYIIYDCGGTSYSTVSSSGKKTSYKSENKIIAADISSSGKIALASFPTDYSSQLQIYSDKGDLQYTYKFSSDYASAVSFNDSGDMCAVACVYTSLGEAYTRIVVLRFDSEEPVSQYVFAGNFVTSIYWSGKSIYAVGDEGIAVGTSDGSFTEYSFEGKSLTALAFADNKAYLAISGYAHSGASTLLVFSGTGEPKTLDLSSRIVSISAVGSQVAVLAGSNVYEYSQSSLELVGVGDAGSDSKACAIQHSGNVYVLGGREIHLIVLDDPTEPKATEEPSEAPAAEPTEIPLETQAPAVTDEPSETSSDESSQENSSDSGESEESGDEEISSEESETSDTAESPEDSVLAE